MSSNLGDALNKRRQEEIDKEIQRKQDELDKKNRLVEAKKLHIEIAEDFLAEMKRLNVSPLPVYYCEPRARRIEGKLRQVWGGAIRDATYFPSCEYVGMGWVIEYESKRYGYDRRDVRLEKQGLVLLSDFRVLRSDGVQSGSGVFANVSFDQLKKVHIQCTHSKHSSHRAYEYYMLPEANIKFGTDFSVDKLSSIIVDHEKGTVHQPGSGQTPAPYDDY